MKRPSPATLEESSIQTIDLWLTEITEGGSSDDEDFEIVESEDFEPRTPAPSRSSHGVLLLLCAALAMLGAVGAVSGAAWGASPARSAAASP